MPVLTLRLNIKHIELFTDNPRIAKLNVAVELEDRGLLDKTKEVEFISRTEITIDAATKKPMIRTDDSFFASSLRRYSDKSLAEKSLRTDIDRACMEAEAMMLHRAF
jgi:Arc/MetJ family transcription regulator